MVKEANQKQGAVKSTKYLCQYLENNAIGIGRDSTADESKEEQYHEYIGELDECEVY
jgi:hypothetical protein